jgi:hypothetical protein
VRNSPYEKVLYEYQLKERKIVDIRGRDKEKRFNILMAHTANRKVAGLIQV